jgi:hypothetical protein
MSLTGRIKSIQQKKKILSEMNKAALETIAEKLSAIEDGAQKNVPVKEMKKLLEELGMNAITFCGKKEEHFAEKHHLHGIYQEKEEAEEWKSKIAQDIIAFVQNFSEELGKVKEENIHNNARVTLGEQSLKATKKKLIEEVKALRDQDIYHADLLGLKWSEAGHIIDTDLDLKKNRIINLKEPEKPTDAVNKEYADKMAQTQAIRFMGGGGIHVGTTPPEEMLNRLWVDTN